MCAAAAWAVQSRGTSEEAGKDEVIGRREKPRVMQYSYHDETDHDDPRYDVKAGISFHDPDYNTYFHGWQVTV